MRLILMISVLLSLIACKHNGKPPKNVIAKDELAALLLDLHLVEGNENNAFFYKDSVGQVFLKEYDPIFKKHKIEKERFNETYTYYYTYAPKELSQVYENVLDSLEKMNFSVNPKQKVLELEDKSLTPGPNFRKHREDRMLKLKDTLSSE